MNEAHGSINSKVLARSPSPKSAQISHRKRSPPPKLSPLRPKSPINITKPLKKPSLSPKRQTTLIQSPGKHTVHAKNDSFSELETKHEVEKEQGILTEKFEDKSPLGSPGKSAILLEDKPKSSWTEEDVSLSPIRTISVNCCPSNVWEDPLPTCINDADIQDTLLSLYSNHTSADGETPSEPPTSINQIFSNIFVPMATGACSSNNSMACHCASVPLFVDDLDACSEDTDVSDDEMEQLPYNSVEATFTGEQSLYQDNNTNNDDYDDSEEENDKKPHSLDSPSKIGYTNQSFVDISLSDEPDDLPRTETSWSILNEGNSTQSHENTEEKKSWIRQPVSIFQRARKLTRDAFSKVRGRSPTPTDVREALGSMVSASKTILNKSKATLCVSLDNEVDYEECFQDVDIDLETIKRVKDEIAKGVSAGNGNQTDLMVELKDHNESGECNKSKTGGAMDVINKKVIYMGNGTQSAVTIQQEATTDLPHAKLLENYFNKECLEQNVSTTLKDGNEMNNNISIPNEIENEERIPTQSTEKPNYCLLNCENKIDDVIFCCENQIIMDENEPWEKIFISDEQVNEQKAQETGVAMIGEGDVQDVIPVEEPQPRFIPGSTLTPQPLDQSQQGNVSKVIEQAATQDSVDNETEIFSTKLDYTKDSQNDRAVRDDLLKLDNMQETQDLFVRPVNQTEAFTNETLYNADETDAFFKSCMSDGPFDTAASESEDMPRKTVSLVISNEAEPQDRDITEVMALISDEVSLKRYPSVPDLTDLEKDSEPSLSRSFNSKSQNGDKERIFRSNGSKDVIKSEGRTKDGVSKNKSQRNHVSTGTAVASMSEANVGNVGTDGKNSSSIEGEDKMDKRVINIQEPGYDTDDDQGSSDLSSCDGIQPDNGMEKCFKLDISTPPNSPRGGFPLETSTINTIISLFETTSILSASQENIMQPRQEGLTSSGIADIPFCPVETNDIEKENHSYRDEKIKERANNRREDFDKEVMKSNEECTINSMYNHAVDLLRDNGATSADSINIHDSEIVMTCNESVKLFEENPNITENNEVNKHKVAEGVICKEKKEAQKLLSDESTQQKNIKNFKNGIIETRNSVEKIHHQDDNRQCDLDTLLRCLPSPPSSSIVAQEDDDTPLEDNLVKSDQDGNTLGQITKVEVLIEPDTKYLAGDNRNGDECEPRKNDVNNVLNTGENMSKDQRVNIGKETAGVHLEQVEMKVGSVLCSELEPLLGDDVNDTSEILGLAQNETRQIVSERIGFSPRQTQDKIISKNIVDLENQYSENKIQGCVNVGCEEMYFPSERGNLLIERLQENSSIKNELKTTSAEESDGHDSFKPENISKMNPNSADSFLNSASSSSSKTKEHKICPILVRTEDALLSSGLATSPKRIIKQGKVTWAMDKEIERTIFSITDDDEEDSSNSVYNFSNSNQVSEQSGIKPEQLSLDFETNVNIQPVKSASLCNTDHIRQLLEMARASLDPDKHPTRPLAHVERPHSTPAPPTTPNESPPLIQKYNLPQPNQPATQQSQINLQNQQAIPSTQGVCSTQQTAAALHVTYAAACDMIDRVSDKMDSNLEAVNRASHYVKRTHQQVHMCNELMARTQLTLNKSAEISARVRNQVEMVARFLASSDTAGGQNRSD